MRPRFSVQAPPANARLNSKTKVRTSPLSFSGHGGIDYSTKPRRIAARSRRGWDCLGRRAKIKIHRNSPNCILTTDFCTSRRDKSTRATLSLPSPQNSGVFEVFRLPEFDFAPQGVSRALDRFIRTAPTPLEIFTGVPETYARPQGYPPRGGRGSKASF